MQDIYICNPASERSILAILLKNQNKILDIESMGLAPEHFYIPGHKYIFMAIVYLFARKDTPTPLAIMEVLTDKKAKDAVQELDGLEYLNIMLESDIHEDNLKIFCDKVLQAYTRRELYTICEDTMNFVKSDESEILNQRELVGRLEERIIDFSTSTTSDKEVYKMGDNTENVLADRAERPDVVPGFETGWALFDRYTSGFMPDDLVVVVARAKTGKSVILLNWARKLSIDDGLPVLYIDTEMSSRNQEDRLLANISGVPFNEIISGMYVVDTEHGLAQDKIQALKKARELLNSSNFFHVFMPNFTSDKINSLVRKYKLQHNIQAVFFDYIKMPSSSQGSLKSMQEYQALGFVTTALKELAGSLGIPIITACQENREDAESTNKSVRNIGGSDKIVQFASKLMFLYKKTDEMIAREGTPNGNLQLKILVQRNGESDCDPININFDQPRMRMWEV
jgi:replicative DNA helicase